jgi:hypothetical protein
MSAPTQLDRASRLALATASGSDKIGVGRRGAALALVAAVLAGSAGVAMTVTAVLASTWIFGTVLAASLLACALLATTAWRSGFHV